MRRLRSAIIMVLYVKLSLCRLSRLVLLSDRHIDRKLLISCRASYLVVLVVILVAAATILIVVGLPDAGYVSSLLVGDLVIILG